ncbi:hypothetical protein A2853_02730 [Candidatus Kaiserbacteria bacterium RIFCSPHIGHO2_01_FULL_55_17]|uniref:Uncharacterized protein n=1 Tax=Candidatus Kaiserbacteria bacterium RIFCSPHIGHO2_01_FULL_55_17 TaxID=1798484 RepID=A0A1F6D882_9BACT|nr:MAG: hypothetical protein A2853_02730 [Candidatus Kaiserbacteria bacterium RIFCSPHIGHO2_01_FULL_55_17]
MFEWLAASAGSLILGSSTPGLLQRFRAQFQMRPNAVKQRTYASADIACVAAAVAAREAALSGGAKTHGDAVAGAYTARATALDGAYSTSTPAAIRISVKYAWDTFKASVQASRKSWQETTTRAWADFRNAIKNCKAPSEVTDTANASSEPRGE